MEAQKTPCCVKKYEGSKLLPDAITIRNVTVIIFIVSMINVGAFLIFYDKGFIYIFPIALIVLQIIGWFGIFLRNEFILKIFYKAGYLFSGILALYVFFSIFYLIFTINEAVQWIFIVCFSFLQGSLLSLNSAKTSEFIKEGNVQNENDRSSNTTQEAPIENRQANAQIPEPKPMENDTPKTVQSNDCTNYENQYYFPPPPSPLYDVNYQNSYLNYNNNSTNIHPVLPIYYQPIIRVPINNNRMNHIIYGENINNNMHVNDGQSINYYPQFRPIFPSNANLTNQHNINDQPPDFNGVNIPYLISPIYYPPRNNKNMNIPNTFGDNNNNNYFNTRNTNNNFNNNRDANYIPKNYQNQMGNPDEVSFPGDDMSHNGKQTM